MNVHTYDFHIGDYARDTGHLSLLEHGIYRLLLDRAYTEKGILPLDLKNISRKIGAKSEREQKTVETVLTEFFQKTANGYHHKRVQEELGEMTLRSLKSKYGQLCRWWDKKEWPNKPTLNDYLLNPAEYYDPNTNHIRQPYERNTDVSRRNTFQPPTANRQPPTASSTPIVPKGTSEASGSEDAEHDDDLAYDDEQGGWVRRSDNSPANPDTTPSAAMSAATLPPKKKKGGGRLVSPEFPDDLPSDYHRPLTAWFDYKRQIGKGYVKDGWVALVAQQRKFTAAQVAESVETSMANVWAGLFTANIATQSHTAQKKEGGVPPVLESAPSNQSQPPPPGLERAMRALYGEGWQGWAPAWYGLTPSDRANVLAWLKSNPEGGAS